MAVNHTSLSIAPLALAVTLAGAVLASGPSRADRLNFCPADFNLWGAICVNRETGDVVRPQTSGEAYERSKTTIRPALVCSAWDVHIATQIEDFGQMATLPNHLLARAGMLRAQAQQLCREERHAEGIRVFEMIFADVDSSDRAADWRAPARARAHATSRTIPTELPDERRPVHHRRHQLTIFTIGYVLCLMTPGPELPGDLRRSLARGFRGSLPVSLGIAVGSMALATVIAVAAEAIPDGPAWERTSRAAGALLLGYVAWRLMKAASPEAEAAGRRRGIHVRLRDRIRQSDYGSLFREPVPHGRSGSIGDRRCRGNRNRGVGGPCAESLIAALLGNPSVRACRWIAAPELARTMGIAVALVACWQLADVIAG
jgi:hypothetical protein